TLSVTPPFSIQRTLPPLATDWLLDFLTGLLNSEGLERSELQVSASPVIGSSGMTFTVTMTVSPSLQQPGSSSSLEIFLKNFFCSWPESLDTMSNTNKPKSPSVE